MTIWAIGYGNWGKGKTEEEARKNLRKQGSPGHLILIYEASDNTQFLNDGSFQRPSEDPEPKLLKRIKKINGRWKEASE